MAQEVKVTADEFRKLRNPYTGKPMDVRMVVGPVPLFHCGPGEYSTSDRFPTAELAKLAWSRRDGVEGMAGPPFVCAYTGAPLSADPSPDGFAFSGGFNPKMFYTREEFLYRASMRNGVSPYPPPSPSPRVEKVVRVGGTPREAPAAEPTDEAVEIAAAAMQRCKSDFDAPAAKIVVGRKVTVKRGADRR